MDYPENVIKQRTIGEQLLLVKILNFERERSKRIGMTFVSKDTVSKWTSMSIEKVNDFAVSCESLGRQSMALDAAVEYDSGRFTNGSGEAYSLLYRIYKRYDDDLLRYCCYKSPVEYYENFTEPGEVESEMLKTLELECDYSKVLFLDFYLQYFVSTVNAVRSRGYYWDVVAGMLWCDITEKEFEMLAERYPENEKKEGA